MAIAEMGFYGSGGELVASGIETPSTSSPTILECGFKPKRILIGVKVTLNTKKIMVHYYDEEITGTTSYNRQYYDGQAYNTTVAIPYDSTSASTDIIINITSTGFVYGKASSNFNYPIWWYAEG